MICRQAEEIERVRLAFTLPEKRKDDVSRLYECIRQCADQMMPKHQVSCEVCKAIVRGK